MVLGRQVDYSRRYDPDQLCPIPRSLGRRAAGIEGTETFGHGEDIWNIFELSWLNPSGKPLVAMAEVRVPWNSPCLIESKSLKLYCNSFNMTALENAGELRKIMARDLSLAAGADVTVRILATEEFSRCELAEPEGTCIDGLDITDFTYEPDAALLGTASGSARETLFTRLFRSCCPVTGQPDWVLHGQHAANGQAVTDMGVGHERSAHGHRQTASVTELLHRLGIEPLAPDPPGNLRHGTGRPWRRLAAKHPGQVAKDWMIPERPRVLRQTAEKTAQGLAAHSFPFQLPHALKDHGQKAFGYAEGGRTKRQRFFHLSAVHGHEIHVSVF